MRTEEQATEALERSLKEREDDLEMAEEFRRRRIAKRLHQPLPLEELIPKQKQIMEHKREKEEREIDFLRKERLARRQIRKRKTRPRRRLKQRWWNRLKTDFTLVFLEADSVTNVTRLGRVSHRRVLIFLGNGDGIIGYGKGKGVDYRSAFNDAIESANKNLIVIKRDPLNTWPQYACVKFNDVRIRMYSNKGGHIWGNPFMWIFLRLAGIYHGAFHIITRKPTDKYALVYAFVILMTKNQTLKTIIEKTGDKVYSYNIGLSSHTQHSGLI